MVPEVIVLVRKFRPGDEQQCQEIVTEGTMSTVNTAFITAILREATFQMIVLTAAVMFIVFGVPLFYCVIAVPIVIVLLYIGIYSGHSFKALEMHHDMRNIQRMYMANEGMTFFVAEIHEPYPTYLVTNKTTTKPLFLRESDLATYPVDLSKLHKRVVGTLALTVRNGMNDYAWLRRMAVKKEYQRHGIASHMIDSAIKFCTEYGYSGIELVTSECHTIAREMYMKKGFDLQHMYHKHVLGSAVTIAMYSLRYQLPETETSDRRLLNIKVAAYRKDHYNNM